MKYTILSTIFLVLIVSCSKNQTTKNSSDILPILETVRYWRVDSAQGYQNGFKIWQYPETSNDTFHLKFQDGLLTVRWRYENFEDQINPYKILDNKLVIGDNIPSETNYTLIEKVDMNILIWRETWKDQNNKVDTVWYHFSATTEESWKRVKQ